MIIVKIITIALVFAGAYIAVSGIHGLGQYNAKKIATKVVAGFCLQLLAIAIALIAGI